MNIDLITKLIRLANNNPNDNEANLAARKVCQLLKDYTFNGTNQPKSTGSAYDDLADLIRKMQRDKANWTSGPKTWKDVKRSEEPEFKSYRPYNDWTMGEEKEKKKPYPDSYDVKCVKCGKTVNVKHSRKDEEFKCGTCAWVDYHMKGL